MTDIVELEAVEAIEAPGEQDESWAFEELPGQIPEEGDATGVNLYMWGPEGIRHTSIPQLMGVSVACGGGLLFSQVYRNSFVSERRFNYNEWQADIAAEEADVAEAKSAHTLLQNADVPRVAVVTAEHAVEIEESELAAVVDSRPLDAYSDTVHTVDVIATWAIGVGFTVWASAGFLRTLRRFRAYEAHQRSADEQ